MKPNSPILRIEKVKKSNSRVFMASFNAKKEVLNRQRSNSPNSSFGKNSSNGILRFRRKKLDLFTSSSRNISRGAVQGMPKLVSSKEIKRFLMNKDERRMMDSLVKDEKQCRNELFLKLNSSFYSYLRTPKKGASNKFIL